MKTLYLECGMGASGDMLMAALLELLPGQQSFLDKMNRLGLPGVRVTASPSVKCGITGTHVSVTVHGEEEASLDEHGHAHLHGGDHDHGPHDHHSPHDQHDHHDHSGHEHPHAHEEEHGGHSAHHHHASLADIESDLAGLDVPEAVRADAAAVFRSIAEAESRVHDRPVGEIHFHEVGTMDAVADVVGVCLLMDMIRPEYVAASPVHVGCGHVRCAHGILPVPAPATALLLTGIPTYGGQVEGELCTPTGAALLRHFVKHFGDRPVMAAHAVGYGMGSKDFERANCLRAFLGECEDAREKIVRLECNLDDVTGEEIGFAMEQLFRSGARDVFTQPIGMKKSRPGLVLAAICLPEDADRLAAVMMKHTPTLGVRRQDMSRYVMRRRIETVESPYGPVRLKTAEGLGVTRTKIEYDDLAALAEARGVSLREMRGALTLDVPKGESGEADG